MYLPDFFWKYRRSITLVVLISLSCLFMIDSCHRKWVARAGNEIVSGVVSPAQVVSESVYDGGKNLLSVGPDFFRTRTQNVALRRRVGELEQEIILLKERMLAEQRQRTLIDSIGPLGGNKIIARVIGVSPQPQFSTIEVDKGTFYGVAKNQPVVSSHGLVGHVIDASLDSSIVLLLTDSNSKVSVIVQSSRAQGVVQGDDRGGCVLKYIEPTADVTIGDVLVTAGMRRLATNGQSVDTHSSGLPVGIYPKGLLVGRIDELKSKPGSLFRWAHVIPATDFRKLEEVAIITAPEITATLFKSGAPNN